MIVEAAGNAPSTREQATEENNARKAAILATLKGYDDLREQIVAWVRENGDFLTENLYRRGYLSSLSAGNASVEIDGLFAVLEWLDYDLGEDPTRRRLSFPANYLWNPKALATAKGHYELRQIAKAEREQAEATDNERAEFERLKAKFEG